MRTCRIVTPVVAGLLPIALGIYHSAQNFGAWDNISLRYNPVWLGVYGATFVVFAFVFGVPSLIERVEQALLGAVLVAGVPLALASVFFVVYDPLIPRMVVVGTPAILFAVLLVIGAVHAWARNASEGLDRVGFVISPEEHANLEHDLAHRAERRFAVEWIEPVGIDATDPAAHLSDLGNATIVVLGALAQLDERVVARAAHLHERGTRVRPLGAFYEEWLGKIPVDELERTSLWFDIRDVHELQYTRVKRVMDVAVALLLFPVFALSVPFVLIGNLAGNRGPLLFRQLRVGQNGREFVMWKYRSMVVRETDDGAGEWTSENDPRITRFGNILRKAHVDELPQVVNVLAGHLSIVGPRPEQLHYVRELERKIPFYAMRHLVKPGITGWAQVKYPYGASEEDALEKLQYELFYLKHQSPALDIRICARTMRSVVVGDGR